MSVDQALDAVTDRQHLGARARADPFGGAARAGSASSSRPGRGKPARPHHRRRRVRPASVRLLMTSLTPPTFGTHSRHAGCHRLDQRDRGALVSRRQQEHVGGRVDGGQVACASPGSARGARCPSCRAVRDSSSARISPSPAISATMAWGSAAATSRFDQASRNRSDAA